MPLVTGITSRAAVAQAGWLPGMGALPPRPWVLPGTGLEPAAAGAMTPRVSAPAAATPIRSGAAVVA